MSFGKVPDRIAGYATYELVEKLLLLSPQQRAAIDRIVQHVYVDNQPIAALFRGDEKICSEANYYRRGIIDPETGGWRTRPGWAHDPQFVDALETAARLALQVRSREEYAALATARRRARLASGAVVGEMVSIATGKQMIGSVVVDRHSDDKDRIQASKLLLDYAGKPESEPSDTVTSDEADWWKSADESQ